MGREPRVGAQSGLCGLPTAPEHLHHHRLHVADEQTEVWGKVQAFATDLMNQQKSEFSLGLTLTDATTWPSHCAVLPTTASEGPREPFPELRHGVGPLGGSQRPT